MGEVAAVVCVVGLGGRGAHVGEHAVVDGDGGRHDREQTVLHLAREVVVREVLAQLHLVDVLQRARRRLRKREGAATRSVTSQPQRTVIVCQDSRL